MIWPYATDARPRVIIWVFILVDVKVGIKT